MTEHTYYSIRTCKNKNTRGFLLDELKDLFFRVYDHLGRDGYFDEYFGFYCTYGNVKGKIRDIELEILLKIRKKDLWPIDENIIGYTEDDLFDIIEFLYINVSKPVDGTQCSEFGCGMHWETFNKIEGQKIFRQKVNELLDIYHEPFELDDGGEILHKPEFGFKQIFEADIPSNNQNVKDRLNASILRYRRHGSTLDDRRQAVRDLADVLEYLRPQIKGLLTQEDEKDLFNLANNFGIRHHNDQQKTDYDTTIWLSWMYYFYLATIHVILRKIDR